MKKKYEVITISKIPIDLNAGLLVDCSVRASLDGLEVQPYEDYFFDEVLTASEGDPFTISWE